MPENEDNEQEQPDEQQGEPPSGLDELLYALANALRDKRAKGAVATLIERYGQEIPLTAKRRHNGTLWSHGFHAACHGRDRSPGLAKNNLEQNSRNTSRRGRRSHFLRTPFKLRSPIVVGAASAGLRDRRESRRSRPSQSSNGRYTR